MFSSPFLEQKPIHAWDNMLPFGLQIHLSNKISDLLRGPKEIPDLWEISCLAQKLVRVLSPSISLSLIDKANCGKTQRECHKCQKLHSKDWPRAAATMAHCVMLVLRCQSNAPWREKSLLSCLRRQKLEHFLLHNSSFKTRACLVQSPLFFKHFPVSSLHLFII